jgi:hypothetical protein
VNPHVSYIAAATAIFFDDSGQPLALNFGNGAASTLKFTVPPQGTVSFTRAAASTNIIAGWAIVISSLPLEGVVQYRFGVNGTPQQGVPSKPRRPQFSSVYPLRPRPGLRLRTLSPFPFR